MFYFILSFWSDLKMKFYLQDKISIIQNLRYGIRFLMIIQFALMKDRFNLEMNN